MSDPAWLHTDLRRDVSAPLRGERGSRSPEQLISIVAQFQVETAERYRLRDVTGDGHQESWCNFFLADVTRALGCPVPQMRANSQLDWLASDAGYRAGWSEVYRLHEVEVATNSGRVVVAGWHSGSAASGHVALCVPSPDVGVHIAQAGRSNFSCRPIEWGFGHRPVRFFHHE